MLQKNSKRMYGINKKNKYNRFYVFDTCLYNVKTFISQNFLSCAQFRRTIKETNKVTPVLLHLFALFMCFLYWFQTNVLNNITIR